MTPVDSYIPLERRFAEPGEAKDSEDLALHSYLGRAMGVSSDIAWPDIYRDGRSCVILGEAGSGKSREMEEQMRRLRSTGVAAAYVDLRDLLIGSALMDGDPMLQPKNLSCRCAKPCEGRPTVGWRRNLGVTRWVRRS